MVMMIIAVEFTRAHCVGSEKIFALRKQQRQTRAISRSAFAVGKTLLGLKRWAAGPSRRTTSRSLTWPSWATGSTWSVSRSAEPSPITTTFSFSAVRSHLLMHRHQFRLLIWSQLILDTN